MKLTVKFITNLKTKEVQDKVKEAISKSMNNVVADIAGDAIKGSPVLTGNNRRSIRFEVGRGKEIAKKEGEGVRYVRDIGRPKVGKVIFEFDVSLPIKKQLHIAEKTLLQHRQALKDEGVAVQETPKLRRDPDEWKMLLRVLDAKAAGAKYQQIADELFPYEQSDDPNAGVKKIYDKLKQAKRLVNSDYRFIPYSEK